MRRQLKMQTTHRAFLARERVVDLGYWLVNTCLGKFLYAVETQKETTVVFNCLSLYQYQAGQGSGNEIKA